MDYIKELLKEKQEQLTELYTEDFSDYEFAEGKFKGMVECLEEFISDLKNVIDKMNK